MPISTSCPHCQKKFRAPDKLAGRSVKCPACQGVVRLPDAENAPAGEMPVRPPEASSASWYILTESREQMGPVSKEQLDNLATKGRLSFCQVRRGDWRAWKWADDVYPELPPSQRKESGEATTATNEEQDSARLVLCPDCGNKVSRRATQCPHCGCPFQQTLSRGEQTSEQNTDIQRGHALQWLMLGLVDGLKYFPVLFATSLLLGLVSSLAVVLAGIGPVIVFGPLLCGFWAVVVAIARRKDTNPGKVFDGFSVFRNAVGLTFLILAYALIGLGGLVIVGFLISKAFHFAPLCVALVLTCLYALAFYLWFRVVFAFVLVIDQNLDVGKSLRLSLRLTGDRQAHLFLSLASVYSVLLAASFTGALFVLLSLLGVLFNPIVWAISASICACIWFAAVTMPAGHFYADRIRDFDTDVSVYAPPKPSAFVTAVAMASLVAPIIIAPAYLRWAANNVSREIGDQFTEPAVPEPEPIPEPEEPAEELLSDLGKKACIDEAARKMAEYIDDLQRQHHLPLTMIRQTAESVKMLEKLASGDLDAIPESTSAVPGRTGVEPYESQVDQLFITCRDWVRAKVKRGACTRADVWGTARQWAEEKRDSVLEPLGGLSVQELTPAPLPEDLQP